MVCAKRKMSSGQCAVHRRSTCFTLLLPLVSDAGERNLQRNLLAMFRTTAVCQCAFEGSTWVKAVERWWYLPCKSYGRVCNRLPVAYIHLSLHDHTRKCASFSDLPVVKWQVFFGLIIDLSVHMTLCKMLFKFVGAHSTLFLLVVLIIWQYWLSWNIQLSGVLALVMASVKDPLPPYSTCNLIGVWSCYRVVHSPVQLCGMPWSLPPFAVSHRYIS